MPQWVLHPPLPGGFYSVLEGRFNQRVIEGEKQRFVLHRQRHRKK